jgi:hypothetical protein
MYKKILFLILLFNSISATAENMKEYKASHYPNDRTYDTAFAKAITNGVRDFYLPGETTYDFNKAINFDALDSENYTLHLHGDGITTKLNFINTSGLDLSDNNISKTAVIIENLKISGTRSVIQKDALFIPYCDSGCSAEEELLTNTRKGIALGFFVNGSQIKNVKVDGFDIGISLSKSWYASFDNILLEDNTVGIFSYVLKPRYQINNVSCTNCTLIGGRHAYFARFKAQSAGSPGVGMHFVGGKIKETSQVAVYLLTMNNFGFYGTTFDNNNLENEAVTYLSDVHAPVKVADVYYGYGIGASNKDLMNNIYFQDVIFKNSNRQNTHNIATGKGVRITSLNTGVSSLIRFGVSNDVSNEVCDVDSNDVSNDESFHKLRSNIDNTITPCPLPL